MDRYIFAAIFEHDEDGYSISFPDLPGCLTCGSTLTEAYYMAKKALELHLFGMEEDGDIIPPPSQPENLQFSHANSFITLIEAYMPLIRNEMKNRSVKKTLTIPKWLNDLAEEYEVNFSQLLQNSLKQYLGVYDYIESKKHNK